MFPLHGFTARRLLLQSHREDNICIFLFYSQLLVSARDAGTPQQISDNATVNIEVVRNDNAPRFEREEYTVSIIQTLQADQKVSDVRAADRDPQVTIATTQKHW